MLRGEVTPRVAALEAARRVRVRNDLRRERTQLAALDQQPARLCEEFACVSAPDLLRHFQSRLNPKFLPGLQDVAETAKLQHELFPQHTIQLLEAANRIVDERCWPLLGFGEKCFGIDAIEWHRDPLSGIIWPLDYHADINLFRNDGSDGRVTWDVNRLAHFITLGRAYAITNDERFSQEFVRQLRDWRTQNPVARGINWTCAMEVALRAMNLLAAFSLFIGAPQMDEAMLKELLRVLDQHGAHIERNLEFSHIATSNHYLADVAGLLWIGVMLPELRAAEEWREFGLRELLREMDKQTLPDGADYEASTGYHRLKVELYLYSLLLCRTNGIEIEEKYWTKVRGMIDYIRVYLRPDGRAPLVGDTDSGQVLAIVKRAADDHGYVLVLGAAVFQEPHFKLPDDEVPEELLWILGERGVRDYKSLQQTPMRESQAFPDAGIYVLRQDDLYLLFNASDSGVKGRGSHGHNDALSIEVSAYGVPFIIDPGTYVYVANLKERHTFRSTAYHSTVQVDAREQNTVDEELPFIIGNEASPRVLTWKSDAEEDLVIAEHYGYQKLPQPVTHRRSVRFDKRKRFWIIEDRLTGKGTHKFSFRFHLAPEIETVLRPDGSIEAWDKMKAVRLFVAPLNDAPKPQFDQGFASTDYGAKRKSMIVRWSERASVPAIRRWAIVPVHNESDASAPDLIASLRVVK